MQNMASLVLKRKIPDMAKMLTNAQILLRKILENSGEELGV